MCFASSLRCGRIVGVPFPLLPSSVCHSHTTDFSTPPARWGVGPPVNIKAPFPQSLILAYRGILPSKWGVTQTREGEEKAKMGVDARTCWQALQNQPTRFCGEPTERRRGLGKAWNETRSCGLALPEYFPLPGPLGPSGQTTTGPKSSVKVLSSNISSVLFIYSLITYFRQQH